MAGSRREEFVKRLSTVGLGTRESIQVMLGAIVCDIRDAAAQHRYSEDEIDEVIAFHDQAEALWRDAIATNPPLAPQQLTARLRALRAGCTGPLGEFAGKLDRGVEHAERFEQEVR